MSGWNEYQDFSTSAKSHGGANAYLSFLENKAKADGRTEGGIWGIVATLFAGGLVYVGVWAVKKAQNHFAKRKQEKQITPIVRQEFLKNVQKYNAPENAD